MTDQNRTSVQACVHKSYDAWSNYNKNVLPKTHGWHLCITADQTEYIEGEGFKVVDEWSHQHLLCSRPDQGLLHITCMTSISETLDGMALNFQPLFLHFIGFDLETRDELVATLVFSKNVESVLEIITPLIQH